MCGRLHLTREAARQRHGGTVAHIAMAASPIRYREDDTITKTPLEVFLPFLFYFSSLIFQ